MNSIRKIQIFRNLLTNFVRISVNEFSSSNRLLVNRYYTTINYDKEFVNRKEDFITKTDPDLFGTLTPRVKEFEQEDEGDIKEDEFISTRPSRSQKLRTKQYADMIKEHLKNNQIAEAINVLEVRMLKEDRVKPESYIYSILISGCAKAGYSKKAFQLYNKMKQRNLKITGGIYTSLFNACSTAPWKNDGLNKANHLRQIMLEKGYEPNASNYNAMIKAFGRCGDILTAFTLVDEMKSKKLIIQVDTFNFLLQACASDKELGFRHAITVWRKMLERNLRPDIFSFNLLLRCTRDCEIGSKEFIQNLIEDLSQSKQLGNENKLQIQETNKTSVLLNASKDENKNLIITDQNSYNSPSLISNEPRLDSVIGLSEISKAEDRFLLLGGIDGFLNEMKNMNTSPDIKTFTAMLDVIPPTLAAERKLLSIVRQIGLRTDIDFFNILIKKRSMRFDYENARAVLTMIKTAKLEPDIVTYGVLSLGCQTREEAEELIQEMYSKNIRINIQILGAMLKQGCLAKKFDYIKYILELVMSEDIKPNPQFLTHLDTFEKYIKKYIKQKNSSMLRKDYNNFKMQYEKFKEKYGLQNLELEDSIKKIREHPYAQFKTIQQEGFEELKGQKLRHNRKIRRKIKEIEPSDDNEKLNQIES